MNDLQIFKNEEFGEVRTIEENGKILFCGSDIAKALGYNNTNDALSRHCKGDGVVFHEVIDSLGRTQRAKFINEGNIYRLITHSKLPDAERFEHWVFDEVIPSIRKTGGYIVGQENLSDSELMAKALLVAQRTIDERNKQIETMKPKVVFADAISGSETSILIRDLAKLLKQNGVDIGEKRLYKRLRDDGYLIKIGESKNTPTQKAMDMKLFEIKESTIIIDNKPRIVKTTKVTGKGQTYFINRFLGEN